MKILANDGISAIGKQTLENAGFTVITDKVPQEELISYVNAHNIEILLVRSATTVRKEVIDACPGLKLIGRGGVGMDNIDVCHARDKGITCINTPAASSQSVAELVMGHMFALSRSLHDSYKHMGSDDFEKLKKKYSKGIELRGKTLGIIGFGRIGQSLAGYALGCGMNVVAVDHYFQEPININVPIGNNHQAIVPIHAHENLHDVIGQMDFISLHIPKQADGSAVIGDREFKMMKPGARLINAARGGVIDEKALIKALDDKLISGVALDVFENEPNPMQELLNDDRIACTPHIGAATVEAQDRIGEELAQLIIGQYVRA